MVKYNKNQHITIQLKDILDKDKLFSDLSYNNLVHKQFDRHFYGMEDVILFLYLKIKEDSDEILIGYMTFENTKREFVGCAMVGSNIVEKYDNNYELGPELNFMGRCFNKICYTRPEGIGFTFASETNCKEALLNIISVFLIYLN